MKLNEALEILEETQASRQIEEDFADIDGRLAQLVREFQKRKTQSNIVKKAREAQQVSKNLQKKFISLEVAAEKARI